MGIPIPETVYELTLLNLDCEVPLSFKSILDVDITVDKIEKSPHSFENSAEIRKLIGRPVKLITFVSGDEYFDKAQAQCVAHYLLATLRLLKPRRIWMSHLYHFIYSDFIPDFVFVSPDIKAYTVRKEELELIEDLRNYTECFQSAILGLPLKWYYEKPSDFGAALKAYFPELHVETPSLRGRNITNIQHNISLAFSYYMCAHNEPPHGENISFIQLFIALEALFLREKDELQYRLSNRVAMLLGETPQRRKHIQESLRELYKLRSTIVHGAEKLGIPWTERPALPLLEDLFEYTRLSILYFIALAEYEKKDIIDVLDNIFDDRDIGMLREKAKSFYPPKLHKVLQFNAE